MRGPPPGYNGPRGYVPRGDYAPAPREFREYEQRRHQGPSPWIPATILGVILLVFGMPYTRTVTSPDPLLAYQAAAAAAAAAASRPSYSFPLPLLWIPVLAVIAFQFFGGGNWYDPEGYGRFGMRGGRGYPGRPGAYPNMAPGAYRNREANRGWGGWWPWSTPSWDANSRYNNINQQRGLLSTFMDYGGHWVLILLGIALFTLVGASSTVLPAPPAVLPLPPLAPQTLGFPWSLFF